MNFYLSIILSIFLLSAYGQGLTGEAWSSIQNEKTGELIVLHTESAKFAAKNNESGSVEGICGEILQDFIQYLKDEKGVAVSPKFEGDGQNFMRMYSSVKDSKGGVIGIGDIGIREERKEEVAFTDAYFFSSDIMITNRNVPDLTSMSDIPKAFSGFKAYAIEGSIGESLVKSVKEKHLPNLEIVYVKNSELSNRVADDNYSFAFAGTDLLTRDNMRNVKHQRAFKGKSSGLAFIMPKGSDWIPLFNEFFKANGGYLQSERYKEIIINHIGLSGYRFSSLLGKTTK